MYEKRGIDYIQKAIIFGDRLNLKKVKELNEQRLLLGFKCSFGIGTWLTNDFKKKSGRYGKECVKISDEITKNTGVPEVVAKVKEMYQISVS
ncbi:hypothetical protein DFJ58DRAFT_33430 [Suillus subalutaceus]|uniref:uncharacterized protein n=1 Tax=Suillus subalutaceus TaxID=48586 RepID=UPI001B8829BE|nr:uncharacterized protein DFJ58DRAFT_33430 [Suillus subalutaceus]KAG1843920.1 hypothetical protein DFJ58DRAFT_33430 [Suillus subalutaceus]